MPFFQGKISYLNLCRLLAMCLFLCSNSLVAAYELAIVSMFRNEAPYLKEWIEYHHMSGVEHFWLYNNESTDNWQEVLKPYMEIGLVEVTFWPTARDTIAIRRGQINAFKDGVRKASGQAKWIAHIDIDEFIVPMQDSSISECLEKRFSNATAVYANWKHFGTNHMTIPLGDPIICQLTACSSHSYSRNRIGKSILRPDRIDFRKICYPHHVMLPQGCYWNGDGQPIASPPHARANLCTPRLHDTFLRINHYALRDEYYYRTVRLPKAEQYYPKSEAWKKTLWKEAHTACNVEHDDAIKKYIMHHHQEKYKEIWE